MRHAGRDLSALGLLVMFGVAALQACGGQSSGKVSGSDAQSTAGATDAATSSAGSASSDVTACSWPADFDEPDAGSGRCRAARLYLSCQGSDGSTEGCLSDSVLGCPDSESGMNVPRAVCTSGCQPGEYALECGGIGPNAPTADAPPACKAALISPGGPAIYCCPCGGGEGSACAPLSPVTSVVQLVASEVVAAGRDADGTFYVLTEHDSSLRLFVSDGLALIEKFAAGTGEGSNGAVKFWTVQYTDLQTVTVEVQKDDSGTHMGVAMGAISGKGFDVGSMGSVLTLLDPAEAAAMSARTTQTFHVGYAGAADDGTNVVVLSPDHVSAFEGYRVFLGPLTALQEQVVTSVARGFSIPVNTTLQLVVQGGPAELGYSGTAASLTSATESKSFTGPAAPVAPANANFSCR